MGPLPLKIRSLPNIHTLWGMRCRTLTLRCKGNAEGTGGRKKAAAGGAGPGWGKSREVPLPQGILATEGATRDRRGRKPKELLG